MGGVEFWLIHYMNLLKTSHPVEFAALGEKPWLFYEILRQELNSTTNSKSKQKLAPYVDFGDPKQPDFVTSFRFTMGMRNLQSTNGQKEAMVELRTIAKKFPERNITTFNLFWLFGDQYLVILPNTMECSIIAVCTMVVIALLLIPHPVCSIWVALAILSMHIGVIGFMAWWDVNLDAISMITIVMYVFLQSFKKIQSQFI